MAQPCFRLMSGVLFWKYIVEIYKIILEIILAVFGRRKNAIPIQYNIYIYIYIYKHIEAPRDRPDA